MRVVTPSGITTLFRELQPKNAELPILVKVLGIVTLASALQFWNAAAPMLVVPSGIVNWARLTQP